MKISLKTNQLIVVAAYMYMVLLTIALAVNISKAALPQVYGHISFILLEALYLLLMYYMISVLTFFKEQKFIAAAFIIYFCLDLLINSPGYKLGISLNFPIRITLNFFDFLTKIYILIAVLNIKNAYIKLPYQLFGASLLIIALIKLIITLAYPLVVREESGYQIAYHLRTIMDCLELLGLISPVSVLLLIKRVDKSISEEEIASAAS